jgi:hypothetical protein
MARCYADLIVASSRPNALILSAAELVAETLARSRAAIEQMVPATAKPVLETS